MPMISAPTLQSRWREYTVKSIAAEPFRKILTTMLESDTHGQTVGAWILDAHGIRDRGFWDLSSGVHHTRSQLAALAYQLPVRSAVYILEQPGI